ncbi:MAG: CopG family transcriptional regulator [Candidatus Hydrogenedentes bacterium]|nr:CopG family transcriptional regulator [Candidatus Hydrogenedentota bacterium]
MSRTVTLRFPDETYQRLRTLAQRENRTLSDFIATAVLRHVEIEQFIGEFEMDEMRANSKLNRSLRRGIGDAGAGRGRFV